MKHSSSTAALGIIANPASGRDIRRLTSRALVFPTVEKVNMIKKHAKPSQRNPQGGIIHMEAAVHASNVMLFNEKLNVVAELQKQDALAGADTLRLGL